MSGCVRTCHCGKTYYHDDESSGWNWEPGELKRLRKDQSAIGLDYAPGELLFEGREYVDACGCWHERATKLTQFIDSHAREIATYLTLEKKRKQAIADAAPVVEEEP